MSWARLGCSMKSDPFVLLGVLFIFKVDDLSSAFSAGY